MSAITLTAEEKDLATSLRSTIVFIRNEIANRNRNLRSQIEEMGQIAHRLHVSLSNRGIPPKHRKHMLDNRGTSADDPAFYNHVHPAEDLLKFIGDTTSNNDPPDRTIGHEFIVNIHSQRWGHEDTYELVRTVEGWTVHFMSSGGECNERGEPHLYDALDHDGITYPSSLPDYLAEVWRRAASEGLSAEEVQAALDQLAAWVSSVEKSRPSDGLFKTY